MDVCCRNDDLGRSLLGRSPNGQAGVQSVTLTLGNCPTLVSRNLVIQMLDSNTGPTRPLVPTIRP